jgi:O-antigen/teichoic acid export membrane protein
VNSDVAILSEAERSSSNGIKSTSERIVGQSAFVFCGQVVALTCAVSSNFLVARMLGPEGKGLIYLLQLIATTGPALLSFGLGPAAVYYLGRERLYSESEIRSGVLRASFFFGLLPFIAAVFAWRWLGQIAGAKLGSAYLILGLSMVPFSVVAWNASYLSLAHGQTWSYNLLRSTQSLWFLLGLTFLLCTHRGSLPWVASCWAISVFVLGAAAPFVSRIKTDKSQPVAKGFLHSAFRFGWRSHLGAVTQFFQQRVDVLLVSFICTLRDVGLYSLAVAVAEVLWYVPQTVANVLMPHVAESSEDGANQLTASFCRAMFTINAFLSLALAVVSALVIPVILPAFGSCVAIIWLLLPGTMAASLSKVLASDLNGRGRPMETVHPPAISLAFCALAGLIVIPRFGIRGAAVVTSAGHLLKSILYLRVYSRITGVFARDLVLLRYRDLLVVHAYCKDLASQIIR